MAAIGWFNAFRENGDPSWFGENRTPVVFDLQILGLAAAFIIPLVAFLLILPGVRHHRLTSSLTFVLSIVVGATILISLYHPSWHEGRVRIYSPYRSFTDDRFEGILGVQMGLQHLNVTLTSDPSVDNLYRQASFVDLEINERFEFLNVFSMEKELEKSLRKGLPYPILKVIEYLSVDRAGFVWGRQYRLCGYYTFCLLWTAFGVWVVQMLMLCLVPHFFCKTLLTVGVLVLSSDLVYVIFLPKHLQIRFPSPDGTMSILDFHLSTCFYATLFAGLLSTFFGGLLYYLQSKTIYTLKTFMSCTIDEFCSTFERERRRKMALKAAGNQEELPSEGRPAPDDDHLDDKIISDMRF